MINVTIFNSSDELYGDPAMFGSDFKFNGLDDDVLDFINIALKQGKYVVISELARSTNE